MPSQNLRGQMLAAIRESLLLQMNKPDLYITPAIDDEDSMYINGVVDIAAVVDAAVKIAEREDLRPAACLPSCPNPDRVCALDKLCALGIRPSAPRTSTYGLGYGVPAREVGEREDLPPLNLPSGYTPTPGDNENPID